MTTWTELVDAAVLGAARSRVPAAAGALGGLALADPAGRLGSGEASAGGGEGASARLLDLAAAASRARRAGFRPAGAAAAPAPEPAEPDHRAAVSPAARQRLAGLLAEGRSALAIEWLRLLAGTGRRPPDVLLPALLTTGTDNQRVREVLRPTLGPRARWLAAANPAWAWAAAPSGADPSDPASVWSTASHDERRDLLRQIRAGNATAGRDLVLSTWTADSFRDRAAFIGALAVGLSRDDEPLLNQALADRRAEVRRAAADLLARLPESAFARRAAARAGAAVRPAPVRPGRFRLVVRPPGDASPEMIADGIDPSPPRGTGRQAWLLRQVVAAAPAGWWPGYAGLPPAELLRVSAGTEWAAALEAGWSDAAIRDRDVAWIEALLDRPLSAASITVFQALTDADRDSWLARHPHSPLLAALELVPGPWSAGLSAAARARIENVAAADPGRSPEARKLLRLAALRLEPPDPPALDPALVHPRLIDSWADMLSVLSIRAAMRRELAEEPSS
jgi:hypothetical protein